MATAIPLTRGMVALVDDEDLPLVSRMKWSATPRHSPGRTIWYAQTRVRGNGLVYLHRLLLPNVPRIDHKSTDGLDCRRENLRPATQGQNCANQRKQSQPTSSRWKGVCWHKGGQKWMAYVNRSGRREYLGLFTEEVGAAQAYNDAALRLWGEYARLNEV